MLKFSIANLVSILFDVLSKSFLTIGFIFFGIIFLIAMIIDIRRYGKIRKLLFVIGWFFVIIFVVFKFFASLNIMLDNFINNIFMQIFFPNLATYFLLIVCTNVLLVFTIFNKKSKTSDKIINYLFFVIISFLLVIILEQIATTKVNIYKPLDVYKNKSILILLESSTLIFLTWMMILGSKKIIRRLVVGNVKNEINDIQPDVVLPQFSPNDIGLTMDEESSGDKSVYNINGSNDVWEKNSGEAFHLKDDSTNDNQKLSDAAKNDKANTNLNDKGIPKKDEIEILDLNG
ncbi:MAG: hypothetical protein IKG40_02305 [Bacilli bacterium]|nr:hypothetical protein [Bacilli bacterium]